jgi:glucoamylase
LQSAALPYEQSKKRFLDQWARLQGKFEDLAPAASDGGALYRISLRLLLAHEDKNYPGAMVASLAIPWGEARGDENGNAGYHLIWTRDLVQSALGLLAAGQTETPLRAFLYLAASQEESGNFPQNFWVNGTPFWQGLQLDEIAFPLILAHRLWKAGAITLDFIEETGLRTVSFLLLAGPITQQDRWEECHGIGPSTLAVLITAMICAAEMAESAGDTCEQRVAEEYADWLESQIERWTVTRSGCLVGNIREHYVRINPVAPGETPDSVDERQITLNNIPPGNQNTFPAKAIVDAGFLELVRYGIRKPTDPLIISTLKVVDALLRTDTPSGTVWRRYNHDGYGQQTDGSSYVDVGQGRGWPLLVGERGHYEVAAQRNAADCIRWMEGLATPTHLLPEQSWDAPETTDGRQKKGRPTGSAVPLLWAHAEYIKLLRSQRDGRVFDLNERVAARYLTSDRSVHVTFWSFAYPIASVPAGATLRVIACADFDLLYSTDAWVTKQQIASQRTKIRVAMADIAVPNVHDSSLQFTFYWRDAGHWEGRNFCASVDFSIGT